LCFTPFLWRDGSKRFLAETMAFLDLQRIRAQLEDSDFIQDIRYVEELDSTNAEALRCALGGAGEGTAIIAEAQWAGRGRQGRTWVSPPGRNLYLSLILRPAAWKGHLGLLAFVGGLAVVDVLQDLHNLSAALKWPNDVLLEGQKMAGILVQTVRDPKLGLAAVLGIGVNINMGTPDFPGDLQDRATSVALHLGSPADRSVFAGRLLETLGRRYRTHMSAGPASVIEAWKTRSVTMGRRVVVHGQQGPVCGEAVNITESGFLVLRTEDGHENVVMAGDVDLQ